MTYHSDIHILGGLPVGVAWEWAPADPSVGIFEGGVDDWWIESINGRKTKADFLYSRIDATPGEEDRIIQALLDDRSTWDRDYE
jgi:hypothetical protein